MIKFYGYKKCSTCRNAEKALEKLNVDYKFIDITEAPPGVSALKKMFKQSGADIKKFFNTSGVLYRELKIKDKLPQLKENDILKMLAANGRLIKRPLVTDGSRVTIGFKEDEFSGKWKS